jgi:hypothetical protein
MTSKTACFGGPPRSPPDGEAARLARAQEAEATARRLTELERDAQERLRSQDDEVERARAEVAPRATDSSDFVVTRPPVEKLTRLGEPS